MTKPCMTCHHKADSHQRGTIIEHNKILRPYSGKCKESGCSCNGYKRIDRVIISKTEVKQIFKLRKTFLESKSKDRKTLTLNKIKDWWNHICIKYNLNIKQIKSITKDGQVILKNLKVSTNQVKHKPLKVWTHESNTIQVKERNNNNVQVH